MDEDTWTIVKWIIATGCALLLVALIWAAASGTFYDLNTRAVHQSVGYVESRNQHARDMITVFHAASDAGQRQATLNDICATANDIPAADVARDVATFTKEECDKR